LNGGDWAVVAELNEVETGKRSDRPELTKALALCRKHKAKLVIAKLDRLSRNLAFIATMMDSGVEFVAVDNPHANKLTLHILAAVAQHEREMIAERTKSALRAAKQRGKVLGRNAKEQLAPRYKQEALARANELEPVLRKLVQQGLSARAIARDDRQENRNAERWIMACRDGPAHAAAHWIEQRPAFAVSASGILIPI
jgi:DNA invertase Pin-like site-specific DNA recombinase